MTNLEFNNEFDVLYNNITSNQAPGLDEYEKSVFLTKALDEIIKSYFDPKSNKVQEGFDDSERRQIDFSMIMRSSSYGNSVQYQINLSEEKTKDIDKCRSYNELIEFLNKNEGSISNKDIDYINDLGIASITIITSDTTDTTPKPPKPPSPSNPPSTVSISDGEEEQDLTELDTEDTEELTSYAVISPFTESFFDMRDNTKSIALDTDILMFINEYAIVKRLSNNGLSNTRLTILPINYNEYSRLMSKPFMRPIKQLSWRLLDNSNTYKKAELVIGPNDELIQYVVRYVKRPAAIRLIKFENDLTIDGGSSELSCLLDPILHQEILQRAVELAKAAYVGDLNSTIALGVNSLTPIGMVTQSR